MGEKPLSTDEAPAQMATIGGAGPLGGFDIPPPDRTAVGIITTRSNIKSAASAVAPPPVDGAGGGSPAGGSQAGDGAMAIKEQGIVPSRPAVAGATDPSGGAAGVAGEPIPGIDTKGALAGAGPVKPEPTRPGDPFPPDSGPAGIAIKEQGVRYGEEGVDAAAGAAGQGAGGAAAPGEAEAPGVAGYGEPIPGIDVIVKKKGHK